MNIQNQRLCAWSTLIFLALFAIGLMLVARFVPPISPSASAEQVAALFSQNTWEIRLGLLITMAGVGFMVTFAAVISAQLKRIEGPYCVLANTQLVCNSLNALITVLALIIWFVTAFRPDRDPDMILLFNDFAWICFIAPFSFAIVQNIVIAVAILSDSRAEAVFPRWIAYFNLWVALLFLPVGGAAIFKSGPLAWNGLLAFWLGLCAFTLWYAVMIRAVLKAIKQQEAEGISSVAMA